MYEVVASPEGFQVHWKSPLIDRPVDGSKTYKHRQAAYRKRKQLNDAILGECQCGEPADIECSIGSCAPLTKYCGYHYEQAHLPKGEREGRKERDDEGKNCID